jgi:hypothetical protein
MSTCAAFIVPTRCSTPRTSLSAENKDGKLKQLGFSENEIQRKESDFQQPTVRVDLIEDVDPITLTAIGFALIAANFLIFANLGDGGIAGLVATVINMSRQ